MPFPLLLPFLGGISLLAWPAVLPIYINPWISFGFYIVLPRESIDSGEDTTLNLFTLVLSRVLVKKS